MSNELSDKVVVVTGAASGLGQGIVEKFVAEGAAVLIADVDEDGGRRLAAECGDAAEFIRTDVSKPNEIAAVVDHAVTKFGRLDVMINNAGISGTMHPSFLDDDLADFAQVMNVNLLGVMAGTKFAAAQMAKTGGGSIVNISSIGGIEAGAAVLTYRASKAAVIHFSKSVALDLAQHDIRVNCIAPGSIPTPLLAKSAAKMGADADAFVAMVRQMMAAKRPLRREGSGADVAEAALFFASERSRYVTATLLPVDGGTSAGQPTAVAQGGGAQAPADAEQELVGSGQGSEA
jgi:NAD(P)-dependent dehydrogenase (short-subunit alcohol dehydrogenase family)